jgi:predicted DNA binding CopG/RHH family protein
MCNSDRPYIGHCVHNAESSNAADHRVAGRQENGQSVRESVGTGVKMSKTRMKEMVIPRFSNEAEEAAWWDRHRSDVEAQIRKQMKQKRPVTLGSSLQETTPSQPVTLRIPKKDLEKARRLAARKGLGYQTYIKILLRDALDQQRG